MKYGKANTEAIDVFIDIILLDLTSIRNEVLTSDKLKVRTLQFKERYKTNNPDFSIDFKILRAVEKKLSLRRTKRDLDLLQSLRYCLKNNQELYNI